MVGGTEKWDSGRLIVLENPNTVGGTVRERVKIKGLEDSSKALYLSWFCNPTAGSHI